MRVNNTKFYSIPCPYCLQPSGRACQYVGREGKPKYVTVHKDRVESYDRTVTDLDRRQREALESVWSGVQQ